MINKNRIRTVSPYYLNLNERKMEKMNLNHPKKKRKSLFLDTKSIQIVS